MTVGIVVIGRNEGARLEQCLLSVRDWPLVYVDSGSSDGSVSFAESVGAAVVELDLSLPFTAARARNQGFKVLLQNNTDLEFVMFVDGDCVVDSNWIAMAQKAMSESPDLSVVCGRRRERYPNATIYNLLCDIEWDTPVGEASACGGDAIYRVSTFKRVGGFDDGFIAGEEPELCFRVRAGGGRVRRLDAEMTLHDADMTHFSQWWKRTERSGYAYYLSMCKHGHSEERFNVREVKSILAWSSLFWLSLLISFVLLSIFPALSFLVIICLQTIRISLRLDRVKTAFGLKASVIYGASTVLAKLPQQFGIVNGFIKDRFGKAHTLIEYK